MPGLLKQRPVCRFISIILSLCIICGSFVNPLPERVKAAVPWVEIDSLPNGIQEANTFDDMIIQKGVHNAADDDDIRYKTKHYYMTARPYDINQHFNSGSNFTIQKSRVGMYVLNEKIIGTKKFVSYVIDRDEFMSAAGHLKVTADSIIKNGGSQTVYLSNVFDVVTGADDKIYNGKSGIFGYQEMLAAVGWSTKTVNYLKGYYNFPYVITAGSIYDVNVIAEDEDGNELRDLTPADTRYSKAIYNQEWPSDGAPAFKPVGNGMITDAGGTSYQYKLEWYYSYTPRGGTGSVGMDTSTVTEDTGITMGSTPDADAMTVHLVYKKVSEPYYYRMQSVDTDGIILKEITKNLKETFSGDKITYRPLTPITVSKKEYNYRNGWYITYEDRITGGAVRETHDASGGPYKYPMPDAAYGSEATISFVYDTGPAITPPVTPPITPPAEEPYTVPDITPPAVETASKELTEAVAIGCIRADDRGGEKFTAPLAIPTTESLYGEVRTTQYLLGYRFTRKAGTIHYAVPVTREYILRWMSATPESAGGGKPIEERVPVTQNITVERAYGYWEIENFECYKIDHAELKNYALPGGKLTLYPDRAYYSPPSASIIHSGSRDDHVIKPVQVEEGIMLEPMVVAADPSDPSGKPFIPTEDFTAAAWEQTDMILVRSDYLSFNGATVISNAVTETVAPDINEEMISQCHTLTDRNVLYEAGQVIGATKLNGAYPSGGTVAYAPVATVNPVLPPMPEYFIKGLDDVVIHTPAVCRPTITADNDKYVQLKNPTEGCVQLVLDPDPDLSDFTVTISNTGPHTPRAGYYTRDFSRSLRDPAISYIASGHGILRNEVQFPFDVYVDMGGDGDTGNDEYVTAGTWVVIGRASPRFYLPMWTREDVHTVNFRTVAVNGEAFINRTETYANTDLIHYVAADSIDVEVSGRIYGLTIYDLTDYPFWEEAFRVRNSLRFKKNEPEYPDGTDRPAYNKDYAYTYTIGTNDRYGNDTGRLSKYTLPLVNGSHPFYKNQGILKTGYMFRYSLETAGEMYSDANLVRIKPSFYHVDKDGKNRTAVDLYYTEDIDGKNRHLVKMGSPLDQINMKRVVNGSPYLGIPEGELRQTAALRNTAYGKFSTQRAVMYNFMDIRLHAPFRTYVNEDYLAAVRALPSYADVQERGITENLITCCRQRWYGEYYLPNEVHAVAKGFDVYGYMDRYTVDYGEDFWLDGGYLIINFSIETTDMEGNRRLSYTNADNYLNNGNCSMWVMEGPVPDKTDASGTQFEFYAGDVMVYYADRRMTDDYTGGVIY